MVETTVVEGPPGPMMLTEIGRRQATLVAVGSHDHRRLSGILLGSVATQLLHDAPCSVLMARADRGTPFPAHGDGGRRRLDGVGQRDPRAADIAHRLDAELEAVVATGGPAEVDVAAVRSDAGRGRRLRGPAARGSASRPSRR